MLVPPFHNFCHDFSSNLYQNHIRIMEEVKHFDPIHFQATYIYLDKERPAQARSYAAQEISLT
jgi:hypothetical protein